MATVELKSIVKTYPGNEEPTVRGLDLSVKDQEFVVLVGPSGCGKSTVLRMIAGLEDITSGEIKIGERVVNELPPKDRDIAMVFQNYALFPNLTVRDNVAFGLKVRGVSREEQDKAVENVVGIVGLEGLLQRHPGELSGGQRQRVAVARAIVRQPDVFLFDEPLSNLDAKLRGQMRADIIQLSRKLKSTTIYVTHDQVEAMTMADRIAVFDDGVLQQYGTPREVYQKPANRFVAGFLGSPPMNFVDGNLADQQFTSRAEGGLRLALPESDAAEAKEVTLGIRPEAIHFESHFPAGSQASPSFKATVDMVEYFGSQSSFRVKVGGDTLTLLTSAGQAEVGGTVDLVVDLGQVHQFTE